MTYMQKHCIYSKAAAEGKNSHGDTGDLSQRDYYEDIRQFKIPIFFA